MKNAGFTLLETIVAVGLIVTGLISSLALINTSLVYVSNVQDRLVAANLAMEGIEIVRNIRDNNWHQGAAWDRGLEENGTYRAAYDSTRIVHGEDINAPMLLDNNGFYRYYVGAITPFVRKISISKQHDDEMLIVSEVSWKRRNKDYKISAEEHLFNWK